MSNPKDWAKQLRDFGIKAGAATRDSVLELGKRGRQDVAEKTPKKSGRASASWNLSVGEPDPTIKPDTFFNPGGAPLMGNVRADSFQLGDTLFISNAVPYIGRLNGGSSKQAPAAFVEQTALELSAILPEIVAKVREEKKT